MEPTKKSIGISLFLEALGGRSTAIINNVCLPKPIGCGKSAKSFRNALSLREYQISGLCQECQDSVFGVFPNTNESNEDKEN